MGKHTQKNKQAAISVIIPAYNEEKTIVACIHSVKNQTLLPDEIIVVDDGSTDKTLHVLSELQISSASRRIKLIQQRHRGPGKARNLGAQHAQGDILVFVDADMVLDENFIKE